MPKGCPRPTRLTKVRTTNEPSRMNGVRRRNESAWLLPNDGSRTNHQLRRDMRRYRRDEEVDIVIVGCGAGGVRPRPATGPAGVAALSPSTPGPSGIPTRTGSVTRPDRTSSTGTNLG